MDTIINNLIGLEGTLNELDNAIIKQLDAKNSLFNHVNDFVDNEFHYEYYTHTNSCIKVHFEILTDNILEPHTQAKIKAITM